VDEFVTRFWPAWMLLFLLLALASLNRVGKIRCHAPHFALMGLLLLPVTQNYVQMEGGVMPMIFFTVLGFVQCALWLIGKDPARLGLGLTLLFGAAMTKFEGFIFLALVGGWMLLLPWARPSWKPSPRPWRVPAFCFLAALPFVCLRVQIPVLNYESGWAGYATHNPGATLSVWPCIAMMQLARFFVNPDFANWSGEGGHLHWIGRWDGLSSLYNHSTLGLAWLCLFMVVALWFAIPARRQAIVWMLAMFVGATVTLSGVFASIVSVKSLTEAVGYTNEEAGGRYLLPVLLAWFATMFTMFFADQHSVESSPGTIADL
jgi:4-amino-4-deoxy-L-arabinose transferase-like glycosyltransferase